MAAPHPFLVPPVQQHLAHPPPGQLGVVVTGADVDTAIRFTEQLQRHYRHDGTVSADAAAEARVYGNDVVTAYGFVGNRPSWYDTALEAALPAALQQPAVQAVLQQPVPQAALQAPAVVAALQQPAVHAAMVPAVQAVMLAPAFQASMQAALQAALPPLLLPLQNTIANHTNTLANLANVVAGHTNTLAGHTNAITGHTNALIALTATVTGTRILLAKDVNATRGDGSLIPYEEIPTAGGDLPSNLGLPALTNLAAVRALSYNDARSLLVGWNEAVPTGPGRTDEARRKVKVYIGSAVPW